MSFNGFPPIGLDLMIENRLMDSQEFYEAHKAEIKSLMIEPMRQLCTDMTEEMLKIDPLFVTAPAKMIHRKTAVIIAYMRIVRAGRLAAFHEAQQSGC